MNIVKILYLFFSKSSRFDLLCPNYQILSLNKKKEEKVFVFRIGKRIEHPRSLFNEESVRRLTKLGSAR